MDPNYVPVPIQFHQITATRRMAYRHFVGTKSPTILYIPGFFSNMELNKVIILEEYARATGHSFIRYDQECTGQSTGDQKTIEFEHWLEDALEMLDHYTQGPVVLLASSLGCWISTLVTQRRPQRIKAMMWLGPGFNCLWTGYWFYYNQLPPDVKARADSGEDGGNIKIKMAYGGWGILRKDFCQNTLPFEIDFENMVDIDMPIRVIHGIRDRDVPYEWCLMAMEKFVTKDFEVVYRKMGDHRLMTPQDLNAITYELDRLINHLKALDSGLPAAPIMKGTNQEERIAQCVQHKQNTQQHADNRPTASNSQDLKSKL